MEFWLHAHLYMATSSRKWWFLKKNSVTEVSWKLVRAAMEGPSTKPVFCMWWAGRERLCHAVNLGNQLGLWYENIWVLYNSVSRSFFFVCLMKSKHSPGQALFQLRLIETRSNVVSPTMLCQQWFSYLHTTDWLRKLSWLRTILIKSKKWDWFLPQVLWSVHCQVTYVLERDKGESESAWLGKGKGRARLQFLPVRQAAPPHPGSTLQGKQPVWEEEEANMASDIHMGTEREWKQWTLLQESTNHIQNARKQHRYEHPIIHQCICMSLSTQAAR